MVRSRKDRLTVRRGLLGYRRCELWILVSSPLLLSTVAVVDLLSSLGKRTSP